MDMEDLNDLLFDQNIGDFCIDPTTSFEDMEDMILNDDDNSKEIEDISFGHMEPIPQFDDLEACITQDVEAIRGNEKNFNK